MKLRAELSGWRLPDKIRPAAGSGTARTDRPEAAKPGTAPRAASPLFRDLALSLGLPRDALTLSLLSLAKFFSLPLDPKLLLHLRQQALSLAPETAPHKSGGENGPDRPLRSAALAAAAAAGKGVVLSPEALGSYAAALAVDDRDGEAPEDGDGREDSPDPPGKDSGDPPDFADPRNRGGLFAERIEERFPLLGILNRIPGRDGRRWISLPFSFESGGVDCKVSLRIMVADTNSIPWKAEQMALDIKTGRRRWSFLLENAPAGAGQACARAVFGAEPPLKPAAERSLRELLGGIADQVVLRNSSDGAFPEERGGAEQWDR
jgi:hypothetical protein